MIWFSLPGRKYLPNPMTCMHCYSNLEEDLGTRSFEAKQNLYIIHPKDNSFMYPYTHIHWLWEYMRMIKRIAIAGISSIWRYKYLIQLEHNSVCWCFQDTYSWFECYFCIFWIEYHRNMVIESNSNKLPGYYLILSNPTK